MMGIGFFELVVLFVLAVLLLGPEQAPVLFRWVSFYYRKCKAGWYRIQDHVEHELRLDEMKKHVSQQEHLQNHAHQKPSFHEVQSPSATASSSRNSFATPTPAESEHKSDHVSP